MYLGLNKSQKQVYKNNDAIQRKKENRNLNSRKQNKQIHWKQEVLPMLVIV